MIRSSPVCLFLSCVICSFWGKDFVSLGRHQWRCKDKIDDPNVFANLSNPTSEGMNVEPVISSPTTSVAKKSGIKCCCGKVCKGARGLKMHQRSCQVIFGLNSELLENVFDEAECNNVDSEDIEHTETPNYNEHDEYPELRKGINLPKSNSERPTSISNFQYCLMLQSKVRI